MNIENIRRVINVISAEENFFNMRFYDIPAEASDSLLALAHISEAPTCGSPACIAGWAAQLDGKHPSYAGMDSLSDFFGISRKKAERVVHPYQRGMPAEWGKITRAEAIAMLENLIETGEVDWYAAENVETSS